MATLQKVRPKEIFMGRLSHGADLLEELTAICKDKNFQLGSIEAIGAVQKAAIEFYDQTKREYQIISINKPLEITNLTGNISIKDGAPFVHAHVTLADASGRACGGHLAAGTIVFACEFILEIFDGATLKREFDQDTGLSLWSMQE